MVVEETREVESGAGDAPSIRSRALLPEAEGVVLGIHANRKRPVAGDRRVRHHTLPPGRST